MQRLDHQCNAKILHETPTEVMFTASWPASKSDEKNFQVVGGKAFNTIVVSKEYFERKYGNVL